MEPWRGGSERGEISWLIFFERKREGFLEGTEVTGAGSWRRGLEIYMQYTHRLRLGRSRFRILLIQEKFFWADKWLGDGAGPGNRGRCWGGHLRKAGAPWAHLGPQVRMPEAGHRRVSWPRVFRAYRGSFLAAQRTALSCPWGAFPVSSNLPSQPSSNPPTDASCVKSQKRHWTHDTSWWEVGKAESEGAPN